MKVKPGNNDRHKGNKPNWHKRKVEKRAQKEKQLFEELGITDNAKETVASTSEESTNGLLGNQRKWYSLSVALPGSILNNAQSPEFRSYVAGEIARSCAIFCVDEVVIFDETARMTDSQLRSYYGDTWTASEWPSEQNVECNFHMARIMEYLECPQYLRKSLYPIQKALKFAGVLNPLDGMHHLRANDSSVPYREGIVLDKPIKAGHGSLCDVGLEKELELEDGTTLPPWTRITVKMTTRDTDKRRLRGVVTSPQVVRNESGLYWGYKVRIAKCFSDIFSKKYDVIIGTSERGTPVSDISIPRKEQAKVLVVFGGLDGIEAALESDESVSTSDPSDFFNTYINSLPDQGSRVIRTEEAIPITLAVPRLCSSAAGQSSASNAAGSATAAVRRKWKLKTFFGIVAVGTGTYFTYHVLLPEFRVLKDPKHYYSDWKIRLYTSLPLNILSKVAGVISRVEIPVDLRKPLYGLYARAYNCRMDEAREEDLKAYPSFAAFFNRSLKDNVRPISAVPLVSPADGTVLHFGEVVDGRVECVKGHDYDLEDFLGPIDCKIKASNRLYQLVVYLAPGDYHGFHSPARWKNHNTVHHPGFLLSVRPTVLTWIPNLLCINERVCLTGAWRHGFFSMSAVAATNVGDIIIDSAPRDTSEVLTGEDHIVYDTRREYKPGDRVGEFRLGSTIVLIFEAPSKLQFSVKAGDTMRYGQSLVVNL